LPTDITSTAAVASPSVAISSFAAATSLFVVALPAVVSWPFTITEFMPEQPFVIGLLACLPARQLADAA